MGQCQRMSGKRRVGGMSNIEAIELGYPVFSDELGNGRISLREPSKELGNTGMQG